MIELNKEGNIDHHDTNVDENNDEVVDSVQNSVHPSIGNSRPSSILLSKIGIVHAQWIVIVEEAFYLQNE